MENQSLRAELADVRSKNAIELEKARDEGLTSRRREEDLERRLESANRDKTLESMSKSQREEELRDQLRRTEQELEDLRDTIEGMRRKRHDGLIVTKLREQDLEGKVRELTASAQETQIKYDRAERTIEQLRLEIKSLESYKMMAQDHKHALDEVSVRLDQREKEMDLLRSEMKVVEDTLQASRHEEAELRIRLDDLEARYTLEMKLKENLEIELKRRDEDLASAREENDTLVVSYRET